MNDMKKREYTQRIERAFRYIRKQEDIRSFNRQSTWRPDPDTIKSACSRYGLKEDYIRKIGGWL